MSICYTYLDIDCHVFTGLAAQMFTIVFGIFSLFFCFYACGVDFACDVRVY